MALTRRRDTRTEICAIGDVHGHLQLALGVAARWQAVLGIEFEAVLLCGDVATFADPSQLDRSTKRFARENRREIEFMDQWMQPDRAPWLEGIFAATEDGGLGLSALPIMTHGNHEGFERLSELIPEAVPPMPIPIADLPRVDPLGHIAYLPNGWQAVTPSGLTIGAIGGIEPGQRPKAGYHQMAYMSQKDVETLRHQGPVDVLITHQAPERTQGPRRGASTLDGLLDAEFAKVWFHGHSIDPERPSIERIRATTVVPLADATFGRRGAPENDSFARCSIADGGVEVRRCLPECWYEFHPSGWVEADGLHIAPPLAQWAGLMP
jgi:hypothetical protein